MVELKANVVEVNESAVNESTLMKLDYIIENGNKKEKEWARRTKNILLGDIRRKERRNYMVARR